MYLGMQRNTVYVGEGIGTDIEIKLLPVMWAFLCILIKIHPLFMKYSNGTSTQCHAHLYPSFFYNPYMPFYYFFMFIVSRLLETQRTIA